MKSDSTLTIDNYTMTAAWRGLLLGMLIHTVRNVELATKLSGARFMGRTESINKNVLQNQQESMAWIEGGRGQVTWEEACESLGVDPDAARAALIGYCNAVKRQPGSQLMKRASDLELVA